MSYYWPHGGDLSAPPQPEDLRVRRPTGEFALLGYWESHANRRGEALHNLWRKWARVTGKPFPGPLPEQAKSEIGDTRVPVNCASRSGGPTARHREARRQVELR